MRKWRFLLPKKKKVVRSSDYSKNKELAREILTKKVESFNVHYKLSYNKIAIRNQKTRWGSCSSLKNLNFNYRLIYLPGHLIDYIVVHELCHLKEMNHGKNFWLLVGETIPDYKRRIKELRDIEKQTKGLLSNFKQLKDRQNINILYNKTAHDDCCVKHRGKSEHAHNIVEQGSG